MTVAHAGLSQVMLKPRKAGPFWGRHPWVLDSAIARVEPAAAAGDLVDLISDTGQWIARGIFNPASRIRVRLYTWRQDEALDAALWRRRIEAAVALRRAIGYDDPSGAARLVYSESDGLCGLVVDRYGGHLVAQPTALAMAARLDELVPILAEVAAAESVTVRGDAAMARAEGLADEAAIAEGPCWGTPPSEPPVIAEHGIRYAIPWGVGQKTGFYLDQRENRLAAARYLRGRRVLDVCCYTGGFSLAAAVIGGAADVQGIDTSARAVEQATANAALNGVMNVRFQTGDAFETLETLGAAGQRYGAVILDPPRFARRRGGVDEALRAYHRLNRLAVDVLEPGGILVTCSCSGSVSRQDFFHMLFGVALKTHREIQVLEARGAAPDHPVSPTCPENEYLKCFICRVV